MSAREDGSVSAGVGGRSVWDRVGGRLVWARVGVD